MFIKHYSPDDRAYIWGFSVRETRVGWHDILCFAWEELCDEKEIFPFTTIEITKMRHSFVEEQGHYWRTNNLMEKPRWFIGVEDKRVPEKIKSLKDECIRKFHQEN